MTTNSIRLRLKKFLIGVLLKVVSYMKDEHHRLKAENSAWIGHRVHQGLRFFDFMKRLENIFFPFYCYKWSIWREFNIERYPILRQSRNYCRNPGGKKTSPWCYSLPHGQEEYCDIAQCPKNMYPHLHQREIMGTIDDSVNFLLFIYRFGLIIC